MEEEGSSKNAGPTARGRPIMTSQDSATERRRLQVRLNQRNLRQRRLDAHEALQKKLRSVQGAVESVSDACINLNDVLVNAGLAAAHVEIATSLRTTLDRVLTLAREAFDETRTSATVQTVQLANDHSQSLLVPPPQPTLNLPPTAGLRDNITQNIAANFIFQEQARTLARAPPSFASLLAFNTVLYGYRVLADQMVFDNEQAKSMFCLRARFESFHDIIDSVRKGLYFYLQCVQLPNCSFGNVIGTQVPSWEELTATTIPFRDVSVEKGWVSQAIQANLSDTGLAAEEFMDPWAVEKYIKEKWVFQLDTPIFPLSSADQQRESHVLGSTDAAMNFPTQSPDSAVSRPQLVSAAEVELTSPVPTDPYNGGKLSANISSSGANPIRYFSSLVRDNDIHILVQRLAKASICFGSEPRWSKTVVDSVVDSFSRDRQAYRAKLASSLSPSSVWFTLRVAS